MGLSMPGRGVQASMVGYKLDSFQVQALDELGQNTMSLNNADNAAAAGLFTPREVAGVEINPTHLTGHELMLPGVTAGINLRICLSDATISHQQSLIPAGGVGDRVVFLAGTCTRNPNQVDVNMLHLMNQQMAQAMDHLSSMLLSQDK